MGLGTSYFPACNPYAVVISLRWFPWEKVRDDDYPQTLSYAVE